MGYLENARKNNVKCEIPQDCEYYVIPDKVCPYINYDSSFSQKNAFNKAIPFVNFVVFHNGNEQDLIKSVESVVGLDCFDKKGYLIVVYDTKNTNKIREIVRRRIAAEQCYFVSILEDTDWYNESFEFCKNGFVCFLSAGFEVDPRLYDILNKAINKDMRRVIYVEGVDEILNQRLVMCIVGKQLKLDKGFSFLDKLRSVQEEQGINEQMIFEWSDL
jgi:hypothetical protein